MEFYIISMGGGGIIEASIASIIRSLSINDHIRYSLSFY